MVLMTDLYTISCGGPNLRAAISHGAWDQCLDQELLLLAITNNNMRATISDKTALRFRETTFVHILLLVLTKTNKMTMTMLSAHQLESTGQSFRTRLLP
jgi:hypothetical protein